MRELQFTANTPLRGRGIFETMGLMNFKILLLSVVVLAHVSHGAVSGTVSAPSPTHTDLEASAEMPVPGWGGAAVSRTTLRITLSLDAVTAESGAEVALGTYNLGDDPDGTAVIFGFEDGGFFILGDSLRTRLAVSAVSPPPSGPRTLTVRIRLDPEGAPTGVMFGTDGKSTPFGGLEPDSGMLLAWFDPARWGVMRITTRGGARNVSATAAHYTDGTLILLR